MDIVDTLDKHYREVRVLIIAVLAIVLLSVVFVFGTVTSHMGDIDEYRFENRRRVEVIEREYDNLLNVLRQRSQSRWSRKDMQLFCTMLEKDNPTVKCPDLTRIPLESFDLYFPTSPNVR